MDEWIEEILEDLPGFLSRCTPIERLEFQAEIDRLADEGRMIVIHGRKTHGYSRLMRWTGDHWRIEEGNADDESTATA